MRPFDNQIVLITGARGGLGMAVTRAFLEAGATVAGVSRHVATSDFAGEPAFHAFPADLGSAEGCVELVDRVTAHLGAIRVLAHLVGGFAGGNTVAETSDDVWQAMFEANVYSAFRLFRAAIPRLRNAGGRIVAVGSRASLEPGSMVGAYSASKAALISLVRTVALENKEFGITANAVLPGTMDTPANRAAMPDADFTRWVQPSRVAETILFLASDAAADTSGAAIPVYGKDL